MSQSAPDLYRPRRGGLRYAILIGVAALAGLIAGTAAAAFTPGTVTSTALVVQQMSGGCHRSTAAIADSTPLLTSTGLNSDYRQQGQVRIESLTPSVVSVSATAPTAAQAEADANAAADSYIYSLGSPGAELLQSATSATGMSGLTRLLYGAGLGLLSGLLAGVAAALAARRFSTLR